MSSNESDVLPQCVSPTVTEIGETPVTKPCDVQHLEQTLNVFQTRLRKRNDRIAELETINGEIERDLEMRDQIIKRLRVEVATLRNRNIEIRRVAVEMNGFDDEAVRLQGEKAALQEGLVKYCENSASMKVCGELCGEVKGVIDELSNIIASSDHHIQLSSKIFAWCQKEEKSKYAKSRLADYVYHEFAQLKTDLEQAQKVNALIVKMQRSRPEDTEKIAHLTDELKTARRVGAEAGARVVSMSAENKRLLRKIEVHMS